MSACARRWPSSLATDLSNDVQACPVVFRSVVFGQTWKAACVVRAALLRNELLTVFFPNSAFISGGPRKEFVRAPMMVDDDFYVGEPVEQYNAFAG